MSLPGGCQHQAVDNQVLEGRAVEEVGSQHLAMQEGLGFKV